MRGTQVLREETEPDLSRLVFGASLIGLSLPSIGTHIMDCILSVWKPFTPLNKTFNLTNMTYFFYISSHLQVIKLE